MGTCTWTCMDGWGSMNEGAEWEANECQMPIWTPWYSFLHLFTHSRSKCSCLNLQSRLSKCISQPKKLGSSPPLTSGCILINCKD